MKKNRGTAISPVKINEQKILLYLVFLLNLMLTAAAEGAAVFIIFRRKEHVYYSILCNLLTNPALNLLLAGSVRFLGESAYFPVLAAAELAVVFTEAAVYKYICGFGMKKSVILSAFLNSVSFATGILMNSFILK